MGSVRVGREGERERREMGEREREREKPQKSMLTCVQNFQPTIAYVSLHIFSSFYRYS